MLDSPAESARVSVTCPCGWKMTVAASAIGRRTRCLKCRQPFLVESAQPVPPAPLDPALKKIKIRCACGVKLGFPETAGGRRARCPRSGHVMRVPRADEPPALVTSGVAQANTSSLMQGDTLFGADDLIADPPQKSPQSTVEKGAGRAARVSPAAARKSESATLAADAARPTKPAAPMQKPFVNPAGNARTASSETNPAPASTVIAPVAKPVGGWLTRLFARLFSRRRDVKRAK